MRRQQFYHLQKTTIEAKTPFDENWRSFTNLLARLDMFAPRLSCSLHGISLCLSLSTRLSKRDAKGFWVYTLTSRLCSLQKKKRETRSGVRETELANVPGTNTILLKDQCIVEHEVMAIPQLNDTKCVATFVFTTCQMLRRQFPVQLLSPYAYVVLCKTFYFLLWGFRKTVFFVIALALIRIGVVASRSRRSLGAYFSGQRFQRNLVEK